MAEPWVDGGQDSSNKPQAPQTSTRARTASPEEDRAQAMHLAALTTHDLPLNDQNTEKLIIRARKFLIWIQEGDS